MFTDRIAAYVLFATTLAGIASTGWQFAGKVKAERELDAVRIEYAQYQHSAAEQYAKAQEEARRKQQVLSSRQQAALRNANEQMQALASERDGALSAARGLYQRAQELATAAKRCEWKGGAAADDANGPADLLADMHRRTDEAAGSIALYADQLRIEAARCRESEKALTE